MQVDTVGRWSSALVHPSPDLLLTVIRGSRPANPPDGSLLLPVMKFRNTDRYLGSNSVKYLMKSVYSREVRE